MNKLIITIGLPGSGKDFWAKQEMEKHPGVYKRVNKDDLRALLDLGSWSREREKFIVEARDNLIKLSFQKGFSVLCTDTNLSDKHEARLRELAKGFQAEFEIKDFTDVTPEECIARDLKRPNSVGGKVIMQMYNQFLKPKSEVYVGDPTLPRTFIFDIDGTLAIMGDRSPFDWAKVGVDTRNESVYLVQRWLRTENEIIIVSGRDSSCREATETWLADKNIKYDQLFMRPEGNREKDTIIKKRIFEENIRGKFNVLGVFDDRSSVVNMWRDTGLTCFQVAPGDF